MLSLHYYTDSVGSKLLVEKFGDLSGQPFLNLGAVGKHPDSSSELTQAGQPPVGQVGDVGVTEERNEVMAAHRVKSDVACHHHIVGLIRLKRREAEGLFSLGQPRSPELRDSMWGVHKVFIVDV